MSAVPGEDKHFDSVTELPGIGASSEQLSAMVTRYRFAAQYGAGKDVLEVACGSGTGLGLLSRSARRVVGGDIDPKVLRFARQHYTGRPNIEVRDLDAQSLPFPDASFDVVLLYEAIYYLDDADAFVQETRRVLKPEGVLIICSVNPSWTEFNPSPFSRRYFSAGELHALLERHGLRASLFGGFSERRSGLGTLIAALRRIAVRFHLIPKTMKGKQLLKRIFMGRLHPLPAEVSEEHGAYVQPQPIESCDLSSTKVLYAVGTR